MCEAFRRQFMPELGQRPGALPRLQLAFLLIIGLSLAGPAHAESAREAALDSLITRLWEALSNDPGKAADVSALRSLFHPEARVFGVNPRARDAGLKIQDLQAFLQAYSAASPQGFYEREIFRSLDSYGDMAHVLATVESRTDRNAAVPDAIGINSIQLHWQNDAWRIVTLYYHLESKEEPIPARYRRARHDAN